MSPKRLRSRLTGFSILLSLALGIQASPAANSGLRLSVYCTAGDAQKHLTTTQGRQQVLDALEPLQPSRLFLESRRGDEYVSPEQLREIQIFFSAHGIVCSGGIATVPGEKFGVRQTGGLSWLNWESPKVRADVAAFFTENAPVFEELIVDDFFCTGDVSPESDRARGTRSWGAYRQELLVSLIAPIMTGPTRAANPHTRLIIKFPQWYDRFHLFGYDPVRMSAPFNQVWVGTEVRDPNTRRMGFVQPTEGYMNFRWLTSIAGRKVTGAWFDHIECSAQNFVDQAYGSVLAGAQEITLFRLGDLMEKHPGDALLATRLPELRDVATRVRGKTRNGIGYYKPPGADTGENLYLADYLGMIGLPILPVAEYPAKARVAFLPVQAGGDPNLLEKMEEHLRRGATVVVTSALIRALGPAAMKLAGVGVGLTSQPVSASRVQIGGNSLSLEVPVELDAAVQATACETRVSAMFDLSSAPFLTRKPVGRGQLLLLNVRTFSEQDFRDAGEWLLAPRLLGLRRIPQPLADAIRKNLLDPLGVQFRAPSGIALVLFGRKACLYSFRDDHAEVAFGRNTLALPAHGLMWLK